MSRIDAIALLEKVMSENNEVLAAIICQDYRIPMYVYQYFAEKYNIRELI